MRNNKDRVAPISEKTIRMMREQGHIRCWSLCCQASFVTLLKIQTNGNKLDHYQYCNNLRNNSCF